MVLSWEDGGKGEGVVEIVAVYVFVGVIVD